MHMGFVFKMIYLMAYFSFPRISNLVPRSVVDSFRFQNLSSFEFLLGLPGIHKFIKWTKILQLKNSVKILKLFNPGALPLGLVAAILKPLKAS